MQSILEHVVKTLHEANEHREPNHQYTILDSLRLLSEERFRKAIVDKLRDPYIRNWWNRDFASWHRQYKAESLAPVQTRLSYYASSQRARAILGQPQSTIDMRSVISEGGVLLVSTSQATAGRDVAALVGASVLNLVDAIIREQGRVPLEQRRGALVVVDEMQTMPGVDYESMLSELGKFGASFVLATQSLAKLSDLSRTMEATLLANVGCLAVFQVAAADAKQLVWELGKDLVTEEDITSLPVHNCYVRATVGTERRPTFSMVRPAGRSRATRMSPPAYASCRRSTPLQQSRSPRGRPRRTGSHRRRGGRGRDRSTTSPAGSRGLPNPLERPDQQKVLPTRDWTSRPRTTRRTGRPAPTRSNRLRRQKRHTQRRRRNEREHDRARYTRAEPRRRPDEHGDNQKRHSHAEVPGCGCRSSIGRSSPPPPA